MSKEDEFKFIKGLKKVEVWVCDFCQRISTSNTKIDVPLCDRCDAIPVDKDYDYNDFEIDSLKEEEREINDERRNNDTRTNI